MQSHAWGKFPLGHLGYWAAAAVILLMGWTLYNAMINARNSAHWVNHSLEVLQAVGRIDESLGQADAGQRGYLLTGDARFTAERDAAVAKGVASVQQLKALTLDNPRQGPRLADIDDAFARRVSIMHATAALREIGGVAAVAERASTGRGQQASQRLYELTAQVGQEENRLLAQRREAEEQNYDHMLVVLFAAFVVSLTVMVPGYIGFIAEARARRRAEAEIRDMANSLPGVTYRLRTQSDGTRRFEFLSSVVEQLGGVKVDSATRDWRVVLEPVVDEDKAVLLESMAAAERDLGHTQHDFRVNRLDGAVRWLHASATLRKEHDGSILWNGYWSDITAEKALQRELHDATVAADSANRAKSTFLATMSHEIRTPMNGVLGMLELLSLTKLDPEQRTNLNVVHESGRSLLRIIDDILDFSKIEAGKLEVRPEVASVTDLVDRVFNVYSGNASSKGLLLKRYVDGRISPAVVVDPLRLQQILNNFVSNAIKFTHKGSVEVRADLIERRDNADLVRFSVADTGIGISEQQKARLFTPFSQVTERTSQRYGGTGLGLAICRRLAEMMGGGVEMESKIGTGTLMTLVIALPIAETQSVPAFRPETTSPGSLRLITARDPPPVEEARAAGSLILLVDDHPINRMVLLKQVNALGYAAEVAEHGLEALEIWSRGGIAVVITDCNMPEMSGYDLARSIRACETQNGHGRTPIIACTANALGGEANCFEAGMDDYLAKPIDLAQLLEKLKQWLPEHPVAQPPARRITYARFDDASVVDPAALAEFSGGDATFERDMLVRFRRYNTEDGQLLMNAVEKREIGEVAHASHRIKGASKTIGAMGLAAASERVERASRANDWAGVDSHMDAFRREFDLLDAHIATVEAAAPVSEP